MNYYHSHLNLYLYFQFMSKFYYIFKLCLFWPITSSSETTSLMIYQQASTSKLPKINKPCKWNQKPTFNNIDLSVAKLSLASKAWAFCTASPAAIESCNGFCGVTAIAASPKKPQLNLTHQHKPTITLIKFQERFAGAGIAGRFHLIETGRHRQTADGQRGRAIA